MIRSNGLDTSGILAFKRLWADPKLQLVAAQRRPYSLNESYIASHDPKTGSPGKLALLFGLCRQHCRNFAGSIPVLRNLAHSLASTDALSHKSNSHAILALTE